MNTQKPLQNLVPELIEHIKLHWESHVQYNSNLIDISNGALLPFVEASMKEELNPRAFARSKNRIPPINILKKLQTKLSKVYSEAPTREIGENLIDNTLLGLYIEGWDLNSQLAYANDLLIINKYCALEPFMNEGIPEMRVLSAKDFLVYSDSRVNPNVPTVFIKFMGSIQKDVNEQIDGLLGTTKSSKTVAIFHAYSDEQFMIFDEEGDIILLEDNPFKTIPFVYLRSNTNELIPTPDSDNLPMVTLIPKLLADLNYAVMFGCRSQVVAIDVEINNAEFSPDSMWVLNSVPGENKTPSLETIKSDVDVDKVLNLINNEIGLWLDTKGIKSGSVGKATVESAASGISKLIDESDASSVNRIYKKIFLNGEKKLWKLLPDLHNTWIASGESDERVAFSKDFKPNVQLVDAKVIPDNKKILEELKLEDELGLFDKKRALIKLNPEASDEEIQAMLDVLIENDILIPLPVIDENNDN